MGHVEHLLVAETSEEYLRLQASPSVHSQRLLLTICVTAIDKLGRSPGARTDLPVSSHFQQSSGYHGSAEPEEQSAMLLAATLNILKLLQRVLVNHKTVIGVFDSVDRSLARRKSKEERLHRLQNYTLEAVWHGVQAALLQHLLKLYLCPEQLGREREKEKEKQQSKHLTPQLQPQSQPGGDRDKDRRSPSPSPSLSSVNPQSLASRLKPSKFFKLNRSHKAEEKADALDEHEERRGGGGGGESEFSSSVSE